MLGLPAPSLLHKIYLTSTIHHVHLCHVRQIAPESMPHKAAFVMQALMVSSRQSLFHHFIIQPAEPLLAPRTLRGSQLWVPAAVVTKAIQDPLLQD